LEYHIMAKAINTTIVSTRVHAALDAAVAFIDRVAELRDSLPAATLRERDSVTIALRPGVASYYGVAVGEHGATGKFVGDDKMCTNARAALSRLVRAVMGAEHKQVEEIAVPKHIAALAAQLVEACAEYEAAGKLLATAVAQARAAK
jgi:hypothetical protein